MNNDDFQQEQQNENSFPPRSTLHGHKDDEKNKKIKINFLQMILGSIAFILIIALIIFFVLGFPGKDNNGDNQDPQPSVEIGNENEDTTGNGNTPTEDPAADENVNGEQGEPGDNDSQEPGNNGSGIDEQNSGEYQIHVVEAGDNLYRISVQYYNTGQYYDAIAKYNDLENSDDVYVGMELKIPNLEYLQQD